MTYDFAGQRALVTGAGKGIGREIALVLAEYGAQVVALSRSEADLAELEAERWARNLGTPFELVAADLTEAESARAAAERAGEIDLLVNNAGISILQPFLEFDAAAFDKVLAVNVRAVMIVSQVIARGIIARRPANAAIVNVSSIASTVALREHAAYCASKGGLDMLTKVMALELGAYNIRVNSVNPTVVLTPMGRMAWGEPEKATPMLARIPLGHFAESRDVAESVAFLLSPQAAMLNGVLLPVDGGFLVT